MEESAVRGVIYFVAFVAILVCAKLIISLFTSKSEAARRARWVFGIAAALGLGALVMHDLGVGGLITLVVVIAAAVWIFKGSKTTPK